MKKINMLIICLIMITLSACSAASTETAQQATATPNTNNSEEGALQPATDEILEQLEPEEEDSSEESLQPSTESEGENSVEPLQPPAEPEEEDSPGLLQPPAAAQQSDGSLTAEAENMVDQSIAHLLELEGVSATPQEVTVVSVEATQWSDGSLGCPVEGMMYTQAIVPGYQIELEVNENIYEVHTDANSRTALCIVNGEKATP